MQKLLTSPDFVFHPRSFYKTSKIFWDTYQEKAHRTRITTRTERIDSSIEMGKDIFFQLVDNDQYCNSFPEDIKGGAGSAIIALLCTAYKLNANTADWMFSFRFSYNNCYQMDIRVQADDFDGETARPVLRQILYNLNDSPWKKLLLPFQFNIQLVNTAMDGKTTVYAESSYKMEACST